MPEMTTSSYPNWLRSLRYPVVVFAYAKEVTGWRSEGMLNRSVFELRATSKFGSSICHDAEDIYHFVQGASGVYFGDNCGIDKLELVAVEQWSEGPVLNRYQHEE